MVKVMTKQSAPFDIEIANQPFDKEIAGQGVRRCCCHCHAEKKPVGDESNPFQSPSYFSYKALDWVCLTSKIIPD